MNLGLYVTLEIIIGHEGREVDGLISCPESHAMPWVWSSGKKRSGIEIQIWNSLADWC